ncbi:MAG: hypothetical protein IKA71_06720 [Lentisphaeria bacterium]|nr:hypothetical protein [Lentisphaeria bacterium]
MSLHRNIYFALFAAVLAGCIPCGEPPIGNVVVNEMKRAASREELREQMVAELTAVIMSNAAGEEFSLNSDPVSAADLQAAVRGCALFTGIRPAVNAKWQLISMHDSGKWHVSVCHDGKVIKKIVLPLPDKTLY